MLFIIATPIGNLKDITLRALETLKTVDAVICEDTRRTSILLNHYNIKKPLLVLNDFNEKQQFPMMLAKLQSGQNLALVSDAGTPLISDPGFKLVRECTKEGIVVDSIPGPSSVITALTLSGLPPDKFIFLGFSPEKEGQRSKWMENLKKNLNQLEATGIIFVAPHKLIKTLESMIQVFSDIEIVIAQELTKIHQKVTKQKISRWLVDLKNPKGEYTVLFHL